MALGDEFYFGEQYETAGTWYDKVLAIDPDEHQGPQRQGRGPVQPQDQPGAEATWKQVLAIDPNNVEAHYDLGFLYLNQATPDFVGVQREWDTGHRARPDRPVRPGRPGPPRLRSSRPR